MPRVTAVEPVLNVCLELQLLDQFYVHKTLEDVWILCIVSSLEWKNDIFIFYGGDMKGVHV